MRGNGFTRPGPPTRGLRRIKMCPVTASVRILRGSGGPGFLLGQARGEPAGVLRRPFCACSASHDMYGVTSSYTSGPMPHATRFADSAT